MKNKRILSILSLIFLLVIVFSSFSLLISANSIVPEDIDRTDVVTDLQKMEAFNSSRYTVDKTVDYCEIIDLIEYGYSYDGITSDYGLYLYIYNPSCQDFVCGNSNFNRVQLRVAKADEEIAGGDTPWRKYSMTLLSKSANNQFYKFRIDVPKSFMLEVEKSRRVYEIADVELMRSGDSTSKSIGSSGKWIYSGYQEYHGQGRRNETSNLSWVSTNLMTIELDINSASWKTNTSDKGLGWQYELSSVYFSVPDKIIEDYGDPDDVYKGLREVDGYYDNFQVTGVSTTDNDFYNTLDQYRNLLTSSNDIPFGFMGETNEVAIGVMGPEVAFNMSKFPAQSLPYSFKYTYNIYQYGNAFHGTDDLMTEESFREQVRDYYNSKKLTTYVGSYGKNTYFNVKTDSSESGDISNKFTSYAKTHGGSWLYYWFTGDPIYKDEVYNDIEPIVAVDENYVNSHNPTGGEYSVSNTYFICDDDAEEFSAYVKNNASGKTTYLMRFAVTDYFASDLFVARKGSGNDMGYGSGNYYFEKEVFLNFDILSLTWENKNGVRTVLPVKASPVDVVGTPTPPVNNDGGGLPGFVGNIGAAIGGLGEGIGDAVDHLASLKPILAILIIVFFVVIIALVPGLSRFLGNIIIFPFKLIGSLFGFVSDNLDRREDRLGQKESRISSKAERERRAKLDIDDRMRWEAERSDRKEDKAESRMRWEAERSERSIRRDDSNKKWFIINYDRVEKVNLKERMKKQKKLESKKEDKKE